MEALERWKRANDEAEAAGREALAEIRVRLDEVAALAAEAERESQRSGIKDEAVKLRRAVRMAVDAAAPAGARPPDQAQGEHRDEQLAKKVVEIRGSADGRKAAEATAAS